MKPLYQQTICDDGKTITLRKSQICAHTTRAPRSRTTSPQVERNNKRRRNETYAHNVNYNFDKDDLVVVLSFDDEHCPSDSDVWDIIDSFCNSLARLSKKHNKVLVATLVPGRGDDGRIHVHMLISKDIPYDWLTQLWSYGCVLATQAYIQNGSLSALANYFLQNADSCGNCGRVKPHKDVGMQSAPIVREEISAEEMFCVTDIEGFEPDYDNSYWGIDDFGHPYAAINYVKESGKHTAKAAEDGRKAGADDGFVDGYTSYSINDAMETAAKSLEIRSMLGCTIHGTTIAALQAYSAGYISAYQTGFAKGQREAFRDIVSRYPVTGYNQLYFAGSNSHYLLERCRYSYINNVLYVLTPNGWQSLGYGVLYAVRNGYITYTLPCGDYYTVSGINYLASG